MTERERAKAIILAIVSEAGGTYALRTLLYKTFYAAHLYYFKDCGGFLSEWPIVAMSGGPGIDDGPALIAELGASGLLEEEVDEAGLYPEHRYRLLKPVQPLSDPERQAIRKAIDHYRGMTGTAASEEAHQRSYSWKHAKKGQPLNIYMDVIPKQERERLLSDLRETDRAVTDLFEFG